jgi:hypothetical protein
MSQHHHQSGGNYGHCSGSVNSGVNNSGGGGGSGGYNSLGRSYSVHSYDTMKLNTSTEIKGEPSYSHYHHHHTLQYQSAMNNSQNYSPHFNSSQGLTNNQATNERQIPGAPPVNRLIDMLNKPTFSPTNNTFLTPTESRQKYNNENIDRSNENACKLKFFLNFLILIFKFYLFGWIN